MDTPETNRATDQSLDEDATVADRTAEIPEGHDPQPTARRKPVDQTAPRPATDSGDAPKLRDVTGTFSGYVRGRVEIISSFARRHGLATALLVVLMVAAVVALALAFARASSVPGHDVIEASAYERLPVPEYAGGTFGHDDILVARSVDVRGITRSGSARADTNAQFGASGYASAEVVVSYSGSSVEAAQGAILEFSLVNENWVGIGSPSDVQVAWTATTGVDQQKVVRNAHLLLARADVEHSDEEPGLAELYDGAQIEVTAESFDPESQTDSLTIRCSKQGTFGSYVCDLTVEFAFRSATGQWEVTSVKASEDARVMSLKPLLGTWEGAFQSQETEGDKCLAARDAGLTLVIREAGNGKIAGTVSGVAHYHEHPNGDAASCDGDLTFRDVPFDAKLVSEEQGALRFEAELPEDVDGTTSLTLRFGSEADADEATAEVATAYPHTGSFLFFPVDETLSYTDLFSLRKAE